jgi:pyruvate ferredoxin oxidoreductase beta subunit
MVTLKELSTDELFASGHRLCAGCGEGIINRMTLKALRGPTIIVAGTGCTEVASTVYPYTAWRVPWVHVAFENAAAVASGIVEAYKAMARRGSWNKQVDVIAMAGDGGTYDIGLQALSGALERGHDFLYICYDNEAYMNTGIQRSGATPLGANTTTSPAGKVILGKPELKKDLIGICAAHGIKYVATASPAYWNDYITKVRKGIEINGPAVIDVLSPCPLGWRHDSSLSIQMAKLAVETRYFPIYEFEQGKYKLNLKISQLKPVEEFLKLQGRFSHLFRPTYRKEIIDEIQKNVDINWNRILKLCEQD